MPFDRRCFLRRLLKLSSCYYFLPRETLSCYSTFTLSLSRARALSLTLSHTRAPTHTLRRSCASERRSPYVTRGHVTGRAETDGPGERTPRRTEPTQQDRTAVTGHFVHRGGKPLSAVWRRRHPEAKPRLEMFADASLSLNVPNELQQTTNDRCHWETALIELI